MFTKDKVIDENKIKKAIREREDMTPERLKLNWDLVVEATEEIGGEINENDFNYYDMYDMHYSTSIMNLSLDELEYIQNNNLYGFDKDNLLDYRCQNIINKMINEYKQTVADLDNCLKNQNIGNYFHQFEDLFYMASQAMKITTILGLDRENVELTPDGKKLKICVDNINKLFKEFNFSPKNSDDTKKLN